MITKLEIENKIMQRAYAQYGRDIKLIVNFLNSVGGSITIYEVMDKIHAGEQRLIRGTKLSKIPFFGKRFAPAQVSVQDDYNSQLYDFLLRFMANLGLDSISVDTLKELNLQQEYFKNYKKEYEDFQRYMFNCADIKYYNGTKKAIKCEKTEPAENC